MIDRLRQLLPRRRQLVFRVLDLLRLTLDKLSISGRWWTRFERWHYGGEVCGAILVVAAESVAAGRSG